MSKQDKLIARFLLFPKDFHFDEMVRLLRYHDFNEVKKGKISGSRVKFENDDKVVILMHKPHPDGNMKHYQMKQVKEMLEL